MPVAPVATVDKALLTLNCMQMAAAAVAAPTQAALAAPVAAAVMVRLAGLVHMVAAAVAPDIPGWLVLAVRAGHTAAAEAAEDITIVLCQNQEPAVPVEHMEARAEQGAYRAKMERLELPQNTLILTCQGLAYLIPLSLLVEQEASPQRMAVLAEAAVAMEEMAERGHTEVPVLLLVAEVAVAAVIAATAARGIGVAVEALEVAAEDMEATVEQVIIAASDMAAVEAGLESEGRVAAATADLQPVEPGAEATEGPDVQ